MDTIRRIKLETTGHARVLRADMTAAERKLWHAIRGKQIYDCRFRRQHPVGSYITDFACIERMLVIELDGGQHQEQLGYDERRTAFLEARGWRVLRFWNNEVMENLDGVLWRIVEVLSSAP